MILECRGMNWTGQKVFFISTFRTRFENFFSVVFLLVHHFFNFRDVTEKNIKRFFEFQNSIEKSFRFDLEYNREEMLGLLGEKLGFIQNIDAFDDAVMKYLSQSVRLIPFFAHRCFFDGMDNMPIVSFWRPTDTIVYGGTFENYLEVEFMKKQRILENIPQRMKNTGIWKDLIS